MTCTAGKRGSGSEAMARRDVSCVSSLNANTQEKKKASAEEDKRFFFFLEETLLVFCRS